jgi:hypothetical protein
MTLNPTHVELESPSQLANRIGLPVSNIRYLIKSAQLEVVYTTPGRRNPKIPQGAWERCIETQRKT